MASRQLIDDPPQQVMRMLIRYGVLNAVCNPCTGRCYAGDETGQKLSRVFGTMKHATSQFLYEYWNEIRDGRLAPKRFEIEPARMGSILSDTFILERSEKGQFSFRLTGTAISDRFKSDLRYVGFKEIWHGQDRLQTEAILDDISIRGGAGHIQARVSDEYGNQANVEYVILPLIHTSNMIDRMVGSMAVLSDGPPAWTGQNAITGQIITEQDVIWPDGRPHAFNMATPLTEQPALAPHVRTARIVRVDRRQFRVYDGGKSGL